MFDDRPARGEIAAEDNGAALRRKRVFHFTDHIVIPALDVGDVLGDCLAVHGNRILVEQRQNAAHDRTDAAGFEQVLHQIFAGRLDVGDTGRPAGDAVEILQFQVNAEASGDGEEVDDGVGGAANCHVDGDGVFNRLAGHDVGRFNALEGHLDGALAAHFGEGQTAGVRRRNGRAARQGHAQSFGDGCHGAGCSHNRAVACRAREAAFNFAEFFVGHAPGAVEVKELAPVGACSQFPVAPLAAEHGATGDHDGRDIGAGRPHDLCRGGFIAAAKQHDGVDGIGPDALLHVHGHQVAEEHGRRLHEHLAKRNGGEFQGKAAGPPNAAFYGFGHLFQVGVAVVELAPGIADADDGLVIKNVGREAFGAKPRAPGEVVVFFPVPPRLTS